MQSQPEIRGVATELLASKGLRLISCNSVQTLWAGYGHICQIKACSNNTGVSQSLMFKYVSPPSSKSNKNVRSLDEGHIRKIFSYQVEQYFYTYLAPQMPNKIAVASCLASVNTTAKGANTIGMVMNDLRDSFPVAGEKRAELNETQVHAALKWLAGFHGFWWSRADEVRRAARVRPPLEHFKQHKSTELGPQAGIWLKGGYTYLATRRKEYDGLKMDEDSEWSSAFCEPGGSGETSVAELAAGFLCSSAVREYQTLIHGDVKSENLFTTIKGDAVAFFDFQYVGLGLGVCDLAKLFTCSVPLRMLVDDDEAIPTASTLEMQQGEETLLRKYHDQLQRTSGKRYGWSLFLTHWETALVDWLRFQASWGFWGNTEWLEARVRSILDDAQWLAWIKSAYEASERDWRN
ncbi:hypothetical protein LTR70_004708 [Exophiala xenobiotica]|uniref:Aminoglycoside phosphotransferase domain-containing protein n=1 Tax=Lithohypha guttulata TaxID=1690604 RepID=A0ABR0KC53_9EURO|nr:hypothetical protein LTR24_004324 [Lithohypha guttulata]KAK5319923.1 hypothetical protein LTR70_004708 [Exophiala xenobiotica]